MSDSPAHAGSPVSFWKMVRQDPLPIQNENFIELIHILAPYLAQNSDLLQDSYEHRPAIWSKKKDQRRYSDRVLEPSSFIFFSWVKGRYEPRFPHGPPCVRSCREYRSGKSKIWMWDEQWWTGLPKSREMEHVSTQPVPAVPAMSNSMGSRRAHSRLNSTSFATGVFQKEWKPLTRRREAWNPEPAQLHLIS